MNRESGVEGQRAGKEPGECKAIRKSISGGKEGLEAVPSVSTAVERSHRAITESVIWI